MAKIDFGSALRSARESDPASVAEILVRAATPLGASDVVLYLVDFGQTLLEPLPDRTPHAEVPVTQAVASTMAGRAFTEQSLVTAERESGVRVWAPVVEGSDRTGVVAVTLRAIDDDLLQSCEDLGLLAGYLIAAQSRCTDIYNVYRRRKSMSVAASMQWDLLPPLVLTAPGVAVAGLIEPAYDVGGDCFDYAANGRVFDFAIMDAMGHGVEAAVISALAMGCYRHGRREGRPLTTMHCDLASTMEGHLRDVSFATGVLSRIDTDTGEFSWTNAGHPPPLLIRDGQVTGELKGISTTPWGIEGGEPNTTTECLQPGDLVMLYTDGVTEARTPEGDEFGLERLIDLTNRSTSELHRPEEIVRRLVESVRAHRIDDLADDATVVLVQWDGPRG